MHFGSKRVKGKASSRKATREVWTLLIAVMVALWLPALGVVLWRTWRESRVEVLSEIEIKLGHDLVYNTEQLKSATAIWFTYPIGSDRERFLLQRDSSGEVHAAVASCPACYSSRKGNTFRDGALYCDKCRQFMRMANPNENLSAVRECVAVPVPFSRDGKVITIHASDMENVLKKLETATPNR